MKSYLLLLRSVLLSALLLPALALHAEQDFVVSDIRVEGLQRISADNVFAAMPINVGDRVDQAAIGFTIRSLFRTGNFDNILIGRDGSILVVSVEERPSISEINIEGNKALETEALMEGLKGAGLAEGQVFKRSTLEGMKMELTRQYVSQGRYDASIETDIEALPRNRVAININIDEGNTAKIKHINIVGNRVYDDEELLDLLELKTTGWFSWLSGNDKYAKEKLSGDLETLKSHYLDRGYITFRIDSTQVSVTPNRKAVYITVNVIEGDKYQVGAVDLSGDLVVDEEELKKYVLIKSGETFSQNLLTTSEEWVSKRLGNDGYHFARVEGIPEIDEENKQVDIKLFVDPGKRTYVRRINYEGNLKTADDVMRREMRQMESAPASTAAIEASKVRLERLGYFKEVKVDTTEVPGTDDMIDITYTVEEQPSGSIGASVGFSQDSGVLLGANLQQDNFLGTGKQIGIGLNKSDYQTNLRFSYVDPYYTKDGVSRGFSIFYRETDFEEGNIARYTTDTFGANLNFGYPLSETERLGFSLGYSNTEINAGFGAVQEIVSGPRFLNPRGENFTHYYQVVSDESQLEVPIPLFDTDGNIIDESLLAEDTPPGFLDVYGNEFDSYSITTSWTQSTLNRGRLATRGASQSIALEVAVPGSDLEFYKIIYNGQLFIPITESFTLRLRTELGYGDGLDGNDLPFFENFFAGGFGSVRGFKSNTLGPRSTPAIVYEFNGRARVGVDANGNPILDDKLSYVQAESGGPLLTRPYENEADPFGGNVLIEGSMELLFPLPFIKDQRSLRSAFFIDAGNVFSSYCRDSQLNCFDVDVDELRYSVGVGVSWITGFGPLTFSFAKPLNDADDDDTEAFQFSLGRSF